MKVVYINNFVDGTPMEVRSNLSESNGPRVSLYQFSGSVSINHSMRPEQAREMAAALIDHADAVEQAAKEAMEVPA